MMFAVVGKDGRALGAGELDKETIAKAYGRWAPVYDLVFGAVFDQGRRAAIAAAERIGGRILEVGVGTGISLPDYDRTCRLFGVDISEGMLRKAEERVSELGLRNVEGLAVMDAECLSFPDASFDAPARVDQLEREVRRAALRAQPPLPGDRVDALDHAVFGKLGDAAHTGQSRLRSGC